MASLAPAHIVTFPQSVGYSDTALSGIYEISKIVTSPSGLKVMLNNVVSVMSSFLDMRLATLVLLNEDGGPGIKVAASTELTMDPDEDGGLPAAVIDRMAATATPLVVENCATHPLFAGWKHLRNLSPNAVRTFIGVPIRGDATVIGVLAIERVWTGSMAVRIDHDVRFLAMVANILAQTLKLHRTIAEDRERLMLEQHRLAAEISALKAPRSPPPKLAGILGNSRALRAVTERIGQVAQSNAPVIIRGETGTGKELFARAIHDLSRRKGKPFIAVNCAALPEGVIESELFGHEKGAFTGAVATRKGRFELADGGTIFLDEIGDISPSFQAKLLRILQEGEFERVGGQHTLKVNFRLVCATNRYLERLVTQEKFRADLYYRMSVVPIQLPPLRERPEDIPELATHFLDRFSKENGRDLHFADSALDVLKTYNFPGNVRELENCVRRLAALATASEICDRDCTWQQDSRLSAALWNGPGSAFQSQPQLLPLPHSPAEDRSPLAHDSGAAAGASKGTSAAGDADGASPILAKDILVEAMEKTGWAQAKAARLLGLTPRQIGYALKIHGVEKKRF